MSANTEVIISIFCKVLFFGLIGAWVLKQILRSIRNDSILNKGIDAFAVIKKIELASGGNEFYPGVKLHMLVEGKNYVAIAQCNIAVTHMAKFQIGTRVKIKVDTKDDMKIALNEITR